MNKILRPLCEEKKVRGESKINNKILVAANYYPPLPPKEKHDTCPFFLKPTAFETHGQIQHPPTVRIFFRRLLLTNCGSILGASGASTCKSTPFFSSWVTFGGGKMVSWDPMGYVTYLEVGYTLED